MSMYFAITEAGNLALNPFGKVHVWHEWDEKPGDRGQIFHTKIWPLCTCVHIAENHNTPCEDSKNFKCDSDRCFCTGYNPSMKWQNETLEKYSNGTLS